MPKMPSSTEARATGPSNSSGSRLSIVEVTTSEAVGAACAATIGRKTPSTAPVAATANPNATLLPSRNRNPFVTENEVIDDQTCPISGGTQMIMKGSLVYPAIPVNDLIGQATHEAFAPNLADYW